MFLPLVRRGQEVDVDFQAFHRFFSLTKSESIKLELFASTSIGVSFVTAKNCIHIGTLVIPVDSSIEKQQTFACRFSLGLTELFASVTNETTGRIEHLHLNFPKSMDEPLVPRANSATFSEENDSDCSISV